MSLVDEIQRIDCILAMLRIERKLQFSILLDEAPLNEKRRNQFNFDIRNLDNKIAKYERRRGELIVAKVRSNSLSMDSLEAMFSLKLKFVENKFGAGTIGGAVDEYY
jgi:hypothetical protein